MFDTDVPLLTILGKYEIKGRILVLPIAGKGDINLTMSKYKNTFTFMYYYYFIIIIIITVINTKSGACGTYEGG